jgi:hypothetical protein
MSAADAAMASDEEEQPQGSAPLTASCVVCYAAPRDVLLPVCGHAVMCHACYAAVRERPAPACPMCRATLGNLVWGADAFQERGAADGFVPPQPRMATLLHHMRQGNQQERDDDFDPVPFQLSTLGAFVAHSLEQQRVAIEGGAVEAACAAMRAAPLRPRVQGAGCWALAMLTCGAVDAAAMRDACARAGALHTALHALRCLSGSDSDAGSIHPGHVSNAVLAMQAVAFLLLPRLQAARGWGIAQAASVARLARAVCDAHAAESDAEEYDEEEEEQQQPTVHMAVMLATRCCLLAPPGGACGAAWAPVVASQVHGAAGGAELHLRDAPALARTLNT